MSFGDFSDQYGRRHRRNMALIAAIGLLTVAAVFLRIPLGPYNIGYIEALDVLFGHIMGTFDGNQMDEYVVWELNAPRSVAAMVIGAGLGVCGAAMQSSLKNPLADPFMTGIASGANLGISLAVVAGLSVLPFVSGQEGHIGNAFLMSLVPAMFIVAFSMRKGGSSPSTMILVGVAVMYVFSGFSTMLNLVASPDQYVQIYTWSLGTLGSVSWHMMPYLAAASLAGIVLLSLMRDRLNVLSYDDPYIKSLGMDPKRIRVTAIVVVSLVTAVLVCFTGTIGFVGLVAPHVMRIFVGSDNRYIIPASAVAGALMLVLADGVAVSITMTGVPVGVVTSLIGGPLFIYLLVKQRKSLWA